MSILGDMIRAEIIKVLAEMFPNGRVKSTQISGQLLIEQLPPEIIDPAGGAVNPATGVPTGGGLLASAVGGVDFLGTPTEGQVPVALDGDTAQWGALPWESIIETPTTLAGYGITDGSAAIPAELGYAQIISNISTSSTAYVDTGLSVTVTVGTRPLIVEAWCLGMWHSSANFLHRLRLYDATAGVEIAYGDSRSIATSNSSSPRYVKARVTPPPGTRTYKVQYATVDAGTASMGATSTSPAFLRVTEVYTG